MEFKDLFKVVWKELRVGVLCGVTLSLACFAKCMLMDHTTVAVALTVSLTVICAVLFAKTAASTLVLVVSKLKLDPAVVASPMLTTIIDAISLLIYFSIATAVLQL